MGKFGWSLPPGCGTLPGEEDIFCEVCLGNVDIDSEKEGACICPECPVCGEFGNPDCYTDGHLQITQAQAEQKVKIEIAMDEENARLDEELGDIEHMSIEDTIL